MGWSAQGASCVARVLIQILFLMPGVKPSPKKTLKVLGAKKTSNIFVQLRKVAQHPLLLRSLYSDATIVTMSTICRRRCPLSYLS